MDARRRKGWLISALTAAFVLGCIYVLHLGEEDQRGLPGPSAAEGARAPAAGDASMRDQLLHSSAAQAGVTPVHDVWGVLMERGYAKGVATVIALADGTASMSLSTGGRVGGASAYPPAHEAAVKLCERAADAVGATTPTREFPMPAKGRVRFYVLTTDGVRTAESDSVLAHGDGGARVRVRDVGLAAMMESGDAVLDALREATARGLVR